MANRYEQSWVFRGDQDQENIGDATFVGMDQKTNDPAAMQPGYCRLLQNARINNGSLVTRNGMFPPVSFNNVSYGTIYGAGIFSDPNSLEYLLLVVSNGVWALRVGCDPTFIGFGSGIPNVSAACQCIQAFGNVILFLGSTINPLYWTGNFSGTFDALPLPSIDENQIPPSNTATYAYSRLWIPWGKSNLAASNIGIFYQYDPNFGALNIDDGRDDNLVTTVPWLDQSLVCFKTQSVYALQNVAGDLGTPTPPSTTVDLTGLPNLQPLIQGIGLVGKRAWCYVGTDIWFMSQQGVYSIQQKVQASPQISSIPISDQIKNTINQINWDNASGIVAALRKERVYFAVPLGNSTRNNILIVFNLVNNAWESIDTFDATQGFCPDELYTTDYIGDRRLFAIDYVLGIVLLLEEGQTDIYYTSAAASPSGVNERQIQFQFVSRGYTGPGDRNNFKRLSANIATFNPDFTITATTDSEALAVTVFPPGNMNNSPVQT